jgi:phenylalanyl-tRNA synthetase alpha chain
LGTPAASGSVLATRCHLLEQAQPLRLSSAAKRFYAASFSFKEHGIEPDEVTNVTDRILGKIGTNLHKEDKHPLNTIKKRIEQYFVNKYTTEDNKPLFNIYDSFKPVVSVKQNFDDLLFPVDHVGRSANDTYYLNKSTLLRTHTSAHQAELMRSGERQFLVTGDVYRRDAIDKTHYPMEGVRIFTPEQLKAQNKTPEEFVAADMKDALEGMISAVFGKVQVRWVDAYFPFTHPSWEMEIFFENKWLEVLGCGIVNPQIVRNCGMPISEDGGYGAEGNVGWAFGLGLERLAMVLFDIPDIRLFWSQDRRFLDQFASGENVKFQSYSKFPPCYKDITFWVPDHFHENAFFELVGQVAGDLVECVEVVDKFTHPKTNRTSLCFRITYRSMDRSLTNEEINELQAKVRDEVPVKLGVELR